MGRVAGLAATEEASGPDRAGATARSRHEEPQDPRALATDISSTSQALSGASHVCVRLPGWTGWRARRRTGTLVFLYGGSVEFNAAETTHVVAAGEANLVPKESHS